MRYRPFGTTGRSISEIGIGTWGMGSMWGPRDDAAAIAALRTALDQGVTFIDTAYVYGNGHSEQLIAQALADIGARERIFIATKAPPKNQAWPAKDSVPLADVFPADWLIQLTETSLKNLATDCIDLQQLHVWSPRWTMDSGWDALLAAALRLKRDGKIRFFGVSLNDHQPDSGLELVQSGLIDSVQVIYNIFDQSPEDRLLPLCQEKGVAVIARVPFDEGSLTDTLTPQTQFPKSDWRRLYFKDNRLKETCARVDKIKADLCSGGRKISDIALQFCLANPAVSTVIPGMRKPEHVAQNVAVSDLPALTRTELDKARQHRWIRNFYPMHG